MFIELGQNAIHVMYIIYTCIPFIQVDHLDTEYSNIMPLIYQEIISVITFQVTKIDLTWLEIVQKLNVDMKLLLYMFALFIY